MWDEGRPEAHQTVREQGRQPAPALLGGESGRVVGRRQWGTSWVGPSGLHSVTGVLADVKKNSLPANYTNGARSVEGSVGFDPDATASTRSGERTGR
jgi:hypothetical protein